MAKSQAQTSSNVSVQQPKGTKSTEVVLGTAAAKLTAGISSLEAVIGQINGLGEKADNLVLVISDRESKIIELEQQLKNAINQNKIELKQQYDADQKAFVIAWMQENNFQMISKEELDSMKTQIAQAAKTLEDTVKKEVNIVTNSLTRQHEDAKKLAESEYKAKEANNIAEINQLKMQNTFLTGQLNDWKEAAAEARKASVEIAKAGTVTQNFANPNGK